MLARAITISTICALMACSGGGETPEERLRRQVIDFNGHIVLMKTSADFVEHRELVARLREEPGVTGATPFMFVEGTLHAGKAYRTVGVKGIAAADTPISRRTTPPRVLAGHRASAPFHVVIGGALARELAVTIGDLVYLVLPPPVDPTTWKQDGTPIRHELRVVGTLDTKSEYDERVIVTTFEAAQAIQGQGDRAMGLEIRIDDERAAARIAGKLRERLGEAYQILDWCELNRDALRCEL